MLIVIKLVDKDRKTIRKYLSQGTQKHTQYTRRTKRKSKLDPYLEVIKMKLQGCSQPSD